MSSKSGGAKAARKQTGIKVVADNRRARYEYEILQTFEAGLALQGSEVKSLREGRTNLAEAYATMKKGELFLLNSNIPEYREANRFNHDPKRPRKLLLHSKEIQKLSVGITREGLTIIPLKIFFNPMVTCSLVRYPASRIGRTTNTLPASIARTTTSTCRMF